MTDTDGRATELEAFVLPASFGQERLWTLQQLFPASAAYHIPGVARLHGPLDAGLLERSLDEIVERHETLRTTFLRIDGELRQAVAPAGAGCDFAVAGEAELSAAGGVADWVTAQAARPFDLSAGPLLRARLARVGAAEHVLVVVVHHIVADGWSVGVLLGELAACYRALAAGQAPELAPLEVQYGDWAAWQRGQLEADEQRLLGFWRAELEGAAQEVALPADRPRPTAPSFSGGGVPVELSGAAAAGLRGLAAAEGTTAFVVLLSVFEVLLARVSGQWGFAVGAPTAGRGRPETEGLIGFFVNTVVLRAEMDPRVSLRGLVRGNRRRVLEVLEHDDLPFERLVEELAPGRDAARNPLFNAMFALEPETAYEHELAPGVRMRVEPARIPTAKFDLTLALEESGDDFAGALEFAADLFDEPTARRLAGQFEALAAAAAADPDMPVAELSLGAASPPPPARATADASIPDALADGLAHERFLASAVASPDEPAVRSREETLTYAELEERSARVAGTLAGMGVGRGDLVAVCADRSPGLVAAVLGVLRAGAAYVPLDPSHPTDRLHWVLDDAGAPVVLADSVAAGRLGTPETARVVDLDEASAGPAAAPECASGPDDLAYIIYTSGSTGRPKGVMVEHRNLAALLSAFTGHFRLGSGRWLAMSTLTFDMSVPELFVPLGTGSTIVLADEIVPTVGGARSAGWEPVASLVRRHGVTHMLCTPSHARLLLAQADAAEALGGLELLVVGGEVLPLPLAERLLGLVGGELHNGYGPTETTAYASAHRVRRADLPVPIGGALPSYRLYVVDEAGRPVPVGVVGELWIGGPGVARGYHARPESDAERFGDDPFSPGGRLYRTGDLVRRRPDGELDFIGRADDQVKVRGHRIEPGEIEHHLQARPDVEAAAAVVATVASEPRLHAYAVPTGDRLDEAEVLRGLARTLPAHMVPSGITAVDALPMTPSGKVDRQSLARRPVEAASSRDAEPVAPRTDLERRVAQVWREVLDVEGVGVRDDFFAAGGNSLTFIELTERLDDVFGADIDVIDLYEDPTVATAARLIAERGCAPDEDRIERYEL